MSILIYNMTDVYFKQLTKSYKPYTGYQPPVKKKEDYANEIKRLEREIELAVIKMNGCKK